MVRSAKSIGEQRHKGAKRGETDRAESNCARAEAHTANVVAIPLDSGFALGGSSDEEFLQRPPLLLWIPGRKISLGSRGSFGHASRKEIKKNNEQNNGERSERHDNGNVGERRGPIGNRKCRESGNEEHRDHLKGREQDKR